MFFNILTVSPKVTELTPKFKEINDVLSRIYQKRLKRRTTVVRKNNAILPTKLLVFSH